MNACFLQLCIEEAYSFYIETIFLRALLLIDIHFSLCCFFFILFHRQVYEAKEEGKVLAALYIFQFRNTVTVRKKSK
jgi:hypothetical protein